MKKVYIRPELVVVNLRPEEQIGVCNHTFIHQKGIGITPELGCTLKYTNSGS